MFISKAKLFYQKHTHIKLKVSGGRWRPCDYKNGKYPVGGGNKKCFLLREGFATFVFTQYDPGPGKVGPNDFKAECVKKNLSI